MGAWSRDKVDSSEINSGNEYTINDNLSLENLNAMVNSGLYSQDVVERMGNVGDYSASITYLFPNIVRYATDGCGYMAIYKSGSDYASFSGIAPTNATYWKKLVNKGDTGATGATGATGNGILTIAKTSTTGLVDTYTVTFTSGSTTTFNVTNGKSIVSILKTSTVGNVDTYTITYNDSMTSTFTVTNSLIQSVNGKNDVNIVLKTDDISDTDQTNKWSTAEEKEKISKIVIDGDGEKALLNNGEYGEVGTVDTVNNVLPDENKNITITADDISDTSTTNKFATAEELAQIATNTGDITDLQDDKVDKVYSTDYAYTDGLVVTWKGATNTYRVGDGTTTNGNGYTGTATEIIISKFFDDGVHGIAPIDEIGYRAFRGKTTITSVKIPISVTNIEQQAFYGCSSLTSIIIPNNVTSIGGGAFWSCSSLTSIEIPSSVTSIGSNAFQNCSSLTSITIPSSVTSIGVQAFWNCSSLTSIEIPSSVTSIGSNAFYNCSSLTSIEIPSSVTSMESNAFQNCSSLTSITIPSSVTSIGVQAFYNCSSLTEMTVLATTPPNLSNTNAISTATTVIYVPYSSLTAYKNATNWSTYADRIFAIPEGKWITEDITAIQANYVTTDTAQDITGEKTFESDVNIGTAEADANLTIKGDLNIAGDIIQDGSTYETHAEQVYTTSDEIILRDGAVGGLAIGEKAGLLFKKYDGTNDGVLKVDKDGIIRVGDVGDEQPLATREETPLDKGFARWDSATNKFITETPDSTPINGSVKPITSNGVFRSTFNRVYRDLTGISGVSDASSINDVCTAMNNSSYLFCSASGYPNLIPSGTTDQNGTLEITKRFEYRTVLKYSWLGRVWQATWRQDLGFSGWKEVATKDYVDKKLTFIKSVTELGLTAPASIIDVLNTVISQGLTNSIIIISNDNNNNLTGMPLEYGIMQLVTSSNVLRFELTYRYEVGSASSKSYIGTVIRSGNIVSSVLFNEVPNLINDNTWTGVNNFVNATGILKPFSATLPYTSWTGSSAPYSKEITVSGILATDKATFEINFNGVYDDELIARSNLGLVYKYVTSANTITFYSDAIPTADIPLTIKVVR